MLENGQEVLLHMTSSVVSIADVTKATRGGRVFGPVFPKDVEYVSKKVEVHVANLVSAPRCESGESSSLKPSDDDEVLRLIKKVNLIWWSSCSKLLPTFQCCLCS